MEGHCVAIDGVTGDANNGQCACIVVISIVLCLVVCMCIMVPCFWNSRNISYSSKKPLDSASVCLSQSKDQSLAFVDKHWCHPVYSQNAELNKDSCVWYRNGAFTWLVDNQYRLDINTHNHQPIIWPSQSPGQRCTSFFNSMWDCKSFYFKLLSNTRNTYAMINLLFIFNKTNAKISTIFVCVVTGFDTICFISCEYKC